MDKQYLTKIIATDNEGLQMVSACIAGGKVKVADIKYLSSNKVFLLSIERNKIETNEEDKKKYWIKIKTSFDNYVRKNLKDLTLRLSKNSKFVNSAIEKPKFFS